MIISSFAPGSFQEMELGRLRDHSWGFFFSFFKARALLVSPVPRVLSPPSQTSSLMPQKFPWMVHKCSGMNSFSSDDFRASTHFQRCIPAWGQLLPRTRRGKMMEKGRFFPKQSPHKDRRAPKLGNAGLHIPGILPVPQICRKNEAVMLQQLSPITADFLKLL